MSMQIVLSLSDETYQRAQKLAQLTQRDVAEVMADALSMSLPQLGGVDADFNTAVNALPDTEILALADLQLDPADDQQLSHLLDKQQAGLLNEGERVELVRLMQFYQSALLQKAEGLAEAVRRGLRAPLNQ